MSELGNTGNEGPSHSRTIQMTPSLNHVSKQKWTGGNDMEQCVFQPDFEEKISKLVQKIGTMLPSQDREFAGHKIPKTGRTLKSVKARPLMSWEKSQCNETRRKTSIALLQCTQCTEAYCDR